MFLVKCPKCKVSGEVQLAGNAPLFGNMGASSLFGERSDSSLFGNSGGNSFFGYGGRMEVCPTCRGKALYR
ncbi:MAG TPA: hypothetical protein DCG34_11550 [Clostridiales bacterium]|jgi:hypothetical protein|nr:hypothetical protein [Clostridiales bacterium]